MKKTNSSKPRKVQETKAEYRVRAGKESGMTLIDQIQKRVLKLSPDKQRQVLDFVAFLQINTIKSPETATDPERGTRIKDSLNQLAKMKTFSEFFRASPLAGVDLTRDKSLPRDGVEL